jgi:integration host factor subunit alpha
MTASDCHLIPFNSVLVAFDYSWILILMTNQSLIDNLKPPSERRSPTMPYPGTLTKAHIVDAVAERNGFARKKSIGTVATVLELVKRSLESGDDVLISGFGKFCVKKKSERKGRNPAIGEDMILVPWNVVTSQCSRKLRKKLN